MMRLSATLFAAFCAVTSFAQDTTTVSDTPNIVEVAMETDELSTLVDLVVAANLTETLSGDGDFTVLAPSNTAFEALPEALLAKLQTEDFASHLEDILLFHVNTEAALLSGDITDGQEVEMANGEVVTFSVNGETISVSPAFGGSADVTIADVGASNGVVHVINGVLTPSSIADSVVDILTKNEGFTTLTQLLTAAGAVSALTADDAVYTVFAPTDEAFASAFEMLGDDAVAFLTSSQGQDTIQTILNYHVVPGVITADMILSGSPMNVTTLADFDVGVMAVDGSAMVNNATVTMADMLSVNGIVHAIDSVLIPPIDLTALVIVDDEDAEGVATDGGEEEDEDVVDVDVVNEESGDADTSSAVVASVSGAIAALASSAMFLL